MVIINIHEVFIMVDNVISVRTIKIKQVAISVTEQRLVDLNSDKYIFPIIMWPIVLIL